MPTMGNETLADEAEVFGRATLAGFFCRRDGEDSFFMRFLFSALNHGIFGSGCIVRRHTFFKAGLLMLLLAAGWPLAGPLPALTNSINLGAISFKGRIKSTSPVLMEDSGMLKSCDVGRS